MFAFQELKNTTKIDLEFSYDSAIYRVKAGESAMFPDFLARHGAKVLADKTVKGEDKRKKLALTYLGDKKVSSGREKAKPTLQEQIDIERKEMEEKEVKVEEKKEEEFTELKEIEGKLKKTTKK